MPPGRKRKAPTPATVAEALLRPGLSEQQIAGLLTGVSRQAVRTEAGDVLPRHVLREVAFPTNRGSETSVPVVDLRLYLTHLTVKEPGFGQLLWQAAGSATAGVLSLVLSHDETTAGNPLAPHSGKKATIFYVSAVELDMKHPGTWLPLIILPVDHDIVGGVSNVLRELVLLLEEQKLLEGVHVRLPGEQDRFVRLKLRYLLADGEALRETWSWRGANAVKPCFKCKNVLKKENKACATNNYFLDIRVDTLDRCDRAGDAEIFDWIDSLRAKKDTLTEAAFEQECKLSGFNLTPGSILTDAAARSVLGPNASCFDPMHLYFTCGGLGCKESTLLVKRAESLLHLSLRQIQQIAKETDWKRPGHCSTARSPGWRQRLFHEKLFSGSWKGRATDCEAMLPLLGVIIAAFCDDETLCKELASFDVLLQIRTPVK